MEYPETMIHLMPSYSAMCRAENGAGVYPGNSSLYITENMAAHHPDQMPTGAAHSSFLIDDILGKKEKARELEQKKREHGHNEHGRERGRSRETETELERRQRDSDREFDKDSELVREQEVERDTEHHHGANRKFKDIGNRDVELRDHDRRESLNDRDRIRDIERDRLVEQERELRSSKNSHILHIATSKTLPSPPLTATSVLPSDIPRPTPINPAAIQTSALTTPTLYKPLPTLYEPSILQQAYMNPHLSSYQSTLMRQMCGNIGTLGSIPGYARHDYPAIFDSQCSPFSKGKNI